MRIGDGLPPRGIGQRVAFHGPAGAGEEQVALVGEVGIDSVPLHAGALGDHRHRRRCRADAAVQIDRGVDDAVARHGLLRGAALLGIGAGRLIQYTPVCNDY